MNHTFIVLTVCISSTLTVKCGRWMTKHCVDVTHNVDESYNQVINVPWGKQVKYIRNIRTSSHAVNRCNSVLPRITHICQRHLTLASVQCQQQNGVYKGSYQYKTSNPYMYIIHVYIIHIIHIYIYINETRLWLHNVYNDVYNSYHTHRYIYIYIYKRNKETRLWLHNAIYCNHFPGPVDSRLHG